jgi:hypothetical protein
MQLFKTLPVPPPPVVVTGSSTVTTTTATISGTVNLGSEELTGQGFMYKKESELEWTIANVSLAGSLTTLRCLPEGTTYQYKAFVTTASGTFEGDIKTFTTATPPSVVTGSSTVTTSTATISGSVDRGSESLFVQGFMYKKETDLTWTTVNISLTGSTLTTTLNSLPESTAYQYKAFATTASGAFEGNIETFTTDQKTGLNEYQTVAKKISLYPSPATTIANLHVEGIDVDLLTVVITDMQGLIVAELKGKDAITIHAGHLNKGVYLVRISGGNPFFEQVEKLIVK